MFTALHQHRTDKLNSRGFSLVELLVVVAILAILAAIAIPLFLNQKGKAQTGVLQADLHNLIPEIEAMKTSSGTLPARATIASTFLTNKVGLTRPTYAIIFLDCAYNAGATATVSSPGNYIIGGYVKQVGAFASVSNTDTVVYESATGKWYKADNRWSHLWQANQPCGSTATPTAGSGAVYTYFDDSGNIQNWTAA